MTLPEIKSEAEYLEISGSAPACLFYFSHDQCNVCKVLKPKVYELLKEKYSRIPMYYVNIHKTPEISGQRSVFTVPSILVYMDGQEIIRKSRNIGVAELDDLIAKPYSIFFD